MAKELLRVEEITVRYSGLPVVQGVSLSVAAGETVCVVGANGAGKSTILRAVMGAQPAIRGRILFRGEEIHKLPTEEIVRRGVVYVPEERMLFLPISVEENLLLGAYIHKDRRRVARNLEKTYDIFPKLRERRQQAVSTLSGGEQQMVAIGRALMSEPKVLMLDEPSLGLAPKLVDEVLDTVRRLKNEGVTILLVEQNVREALDLADRAYVIQSGRVVLEGTGADLLENPEVKSAYLGF
ncbi:amino acid/amide ABC transporter ATP-binding protein 2, HAAT family (TC 3.A.1.4.-) [Desulfacinum hydrothermale DSM 13146]|uniref:Amino acid/amide ABC transporter ATP-binding protein 2, HAAT family (TC 3.A.1.4.-) n=1 Tax=Desulfacinum hydrothermale DSM 13146 TaxID=1121390 RepID=A0A1W1XMZ2_9BACT|nr:ABC transporter ATP-binding protein [Desulfacinum hydrothermale]SMC25286.1 amino acid/amide ABC transporter ATP-binding protein 2, HAAT family (TC 3.A.1.4.-) [Desulfacinum hydrothermale DSM 13146]